MVRIIVLFRSNIISNTKQFIANHACVHTLLQKDFRTRQMTMAHFRSILRSHSFHFWKSYFITCFKLVRTSTSRASTQKFLYRLTYRVTNHISSWHPLVSIYPVDPYPWPLSSSGQLHTWMRIEPENGSDASPSSLPINQPV